MSVPQSGGGLVSSRDDLVQFLESGVKPDRSDWRIGTEHEKFVYRRSDFGPVAYEGSTGIRAILEGLQTYGWEPIEEAGHLIGLTKDGANVSLEPGGQLELSGAPLRTLHQTCDEVHSHLNQCKEVAEKTGVGFLGLGFSPNLSRADAPVMPKGRYGIMTEYMPKRGSLGVDMMYRSCTIQVNLDFASEERMVKMFRTSLALQPLATALFANSPFTEGKPNGYLSFRAAIWQDTDPDRTGLLPFVFEEGMGFERYVDYALDVPMYFVYRDGVYRDVTGQSFRDFLAGKLPGLPGERPTLDDWANHLTTIFPEVRIKKFMEMRGADGGPWRRICALPALWVGLMYDDGALDAAWDLVKNWSAEDRQAVYTSVAKHGLNTNAPGGGTIQPIAKEMLNIASQGLKNRARMDNFGTDEAGFLETLHHIADTGIAPAQEMLNKYEGDWAGDISRLFAEYSY